MMPMFDMGLVSVKQQPSRGTCRLSFRCGCKAWAMKGGGPGGYWRPIDANICGRVVTCKTSTWARDEAIRVSTERRALEVKG
jgi:hypothetical protein